MKDEFKALRVRAVDRAMLEKMMAPYRALKALRARRSAAAKKGWRTRKRMAEARAHGYDPAFVEKVLRADAAPAEASFNNISEMLNWLDR